MGFARIPLIFRKLRIIFISKCSQIANPWSKSEGCGAEKLRVLGKAVLNKAQKKHGDIAAPCGVWLKLAETSSWKSLNDIRKTLPATDAVDGRHVFNIKGNTYRLIANINFKSSTIFIDALLTHAEYTKGDWK